MDPQNAASASNTNSIHTDPELVAAVQVLRRLLPSDTPARRRAFTAALDDLVGPEG